MKAKKQKSNFKPSSSSSFTKNPIQKTFYASFITTKNKNKISTTRGSTTYQLDKRLSLRKTPFSKNYMHTDGNTKESPMQIKSIFTISSKVSPSATMKLQREHRHAFSVTEKKRSQSEEETNTLKGKKNNSVSHFYIPSINLIFQCDKKKEECDVSNKTFNIKSRKKINESINNMNKTHSITNLNHHYHCATLSSSIKSTTAKRPSIKAYKYPVISVLKRVHASSSTHSSSTNTSNKKIISIMQIADKIITNTHAPSYINTETKNSKTASKNYSVVNIVIKSNWGNKTKTGITEVQLYDNKHRRIPIAVCHVFNGCEDNIGRIHNGKFHSLNDTDMWTTPVSSSPIKTEISILNSSSNKNDVEDIVIWNYNGKDVNKGIKEIEVWKRNIIKWKGIVPKGAYNKKSDYSFKIKLNSTSEVNRITNIAIKNNKGNISNRDSNNFVRQRNHLFLSLYKNNKSNNSVNNLNSNNKVEFVSSIVSERRSDNNLFEDNDTSFDYVSFNKITIVLSKSYNNGDVIGLTGIAFFDKNNKQINIDSASAIGALPKDLRTLYNDEDDYRIFENVFNGVNNTIDENNMWATINKEKPPYLELYFQEKVTLSSIVFWNYNSPFELDKGVREVTIIFDDNNNIVKKKSFLLRKGTGYILRNHSLNDEHCLCGQRISFTNDKQNETISRLARMVHICNTKRISVPCGYMIKCVLLSIYDNSDTVRINSMKFYDIENEDISSYANVSMLKYGIINESEDEEIQSDIMYIDRFDNYKKNPYSLANNIIVFNFGIVVDIGYIHIHNDNIKDIQLYIDDILIFEGRINKEDDNYIIFHNDYSCIKDTAKIVNVSPSPKVKIDESVNDNIKRMTLSQI